MAIEDSSEAWPIVSDDYFATAIRTQLISDGIPQDAANGILQNAVRILGNCPNPMDDGPCSRTGIIIGRVQSGKTSNFISLVALAFDNGYDIAIVLGGNTKNLLRQNAGRIKNYFVGTEGKLAILNTKENAGILNRPREIRHFLDHGKKVLIVGLKHHGDINKIAKIFDSHELKGVSAMIVDDEGDQATLKEITRVTATYQAAMRLKRNIPRHCFLSITATPQANILIDTVDNLSPDFGALIYPGDNYCGLSVFHDSPENPLVRDVIDDESVSLLDDSGIPPSFYEALATFFVGGALRAYRGDTDPHAMLIHPSQKKVEHSKVVGKVDNLLENWKERAGARLSGEEDISYDTLRGYLQHAFDLLVQDGVRMPSFGELERYMLEAIVGCSCVLLCNSDDDASKNASFYRLSIFVGGNMVERGLTISGLAVTYIMRRARGMANVDNTEQRARWFGYKRNYLDVCRVYTTHSIADDFATIAAHEEDLWQTIETALDAGVRFKEMPRLFELPPRRFAADASQGGKSDKAAILRVASPNEACIATRDIDAK